ncbi:hypothetical protein BKA59DRAFT_541977 [Fusarium tricinctum]|uniref:Uncharacterized protein n=1 Tax=Fusarium tricinctum TaxID=61284 RepID=A0A8K0S5D1_9HYPO|nr:hypothetical protein BKA59DRAFT_541977 [Fusarium tricinctum]
MAAGDEYTYSSNEDEDDSHDESIRTQHRLKQIKKKRDKRTSAIVKESSVAMNKLRARVAAYQQDRTNTEMETVASSVLKIIEAVERRKQIEEQMETLVLQVTSTTREIEEMMRIGFRGRAEDIKKV